jgi:hypothetical protein
MTQARDLIDKVKDLKSKSDSMAVKRTRGTVSGGFIGMGLGLLYGVAKGYNLVSSAFLGALLGGTISHLLLPKLDEEEE